MLERVFGWLLFAFFTIGTLWGVLKFCLIFEIVLLTSMFDIGGDAI